MRLEFHHKAISLACVRAQERLKNNAIAPPTTWYPVLVRGSWMNDTNQVTAAQDFIDAGGCVTPRSRPAVVLDETARAFFHQYWGHALEQELDRIRRSDWAAIYPECRKNASSITDVLDIGTYSQFDHYDVLPEQLAKELAQAADHYAVAQTVGNTAIFLETVRLEHSTIDKNEDERRDASHVSELGRAVHTLEDFFAHSNWVELLLWELACRGKLDDGLVEYFNREVSLVRSAEELAVDYYTPLPRKASERTGGLIEAMWYGPSPAETPLSSLIFDLEDTAYTLLQMYAHFLERNQPAEMSDDVLDLVFAIIDVSGAPVPVPVLRMMANAAVKLREWFQDIGRGAREFVTSLLIERAMSSTTNPTARQLLQTAGALLERYDSATAAEWARAGRLRYVAETIKHDLAVRQRAEGNAEPRLAHHSVLAKDGPALAPDAALRFNLACYFATEVTTQIFEWHFRRDIRSVTSRFEWLRDNLLRHPSWVLEHGILDPDETAGLVNTMFTGSWEELAEHHDPIIQEVHA